MVQNLWGAWRRLASASRGVSEGLRLQPDLVALVEGRRDRGVRPDDRRAWGGLPLRASAGAGAGRRGRPRAGARALPRESWAIGETRELDLHLTPRTEGFACGTLAAEILAPEPLGRLVFALHNPSWSRDRHQGRPRGRRAACGQTRTRPGNALPRPPAASARFWTGRQALDGASVCYRDAWERARTRASPGGQNTGRSCDYVKAERLAASAQSEPAASTTGACFRWSQVSVRRLRSGRVKSRLIRLARWPSPEEASPLHELECTRAPRGGVPRRGDLFCGPESPCSLPRALAM